MKILLDTNIVIHRESTASQINRDIGVLFKWLDNLHYRKVVHPITVKEINKLRNPATRDIFNVKLDSYNVLQSQAPMSPEVAKQSIKVDTTENDKNDTLLLNEVYCERVDYLITEDKKIAKKAEALGINNRVFSIEAFLEKVVAENPSLADYKVLAVRKKLFGNIDYKDEFFDSFREDYPGFDKWFNKKSEETAYVCDSSGKTVAFLYLKIEDYDEPYPDIHPAFEKKKRLKIGTLKVTLNGYKLGERFVKIIFDNAIRYGVDEVYVTIFDKRLEQQRLIRLFEEYGFVKHGTKGDNEFVYVRDMRRKYNEQNPKLTFPYFSTKSRSFIVPIYPDYHTSLFPDSILRTESPASFVENEPFRNAISKVYISRSHFKDLHSGDVIIFYRTGGYYESVISTVGIVENVITRIKNVTQFIELCRKRSVFSDDELKKHWERYPSIKPFVVNFLYAYSFPKRINMKHLIEMGIISDIKSAPRGFTLLEPAKFEAILKESKTDESIAVD